MTWREGYVIGLAVGAAFGQYVRYLWTAFGPQRFADKENN